MAFAAVFFLLTFVLIALDPSGGDGSILHSPKEEDDIHTPKVAAFHLVTLNPARVVFEKRE